MNDTLYTLCRNTFGHEPVRELLLKGEGSNRHYYRIWTDDSHTCIGVEGTSAEENLAFVTIARQMEGHGLPVPHILAVSGDMMCYLQDDLGDTSLFDALKDGRNDPRRYADTDLFTLLERTIRLLPWVQCLTADGLDTSVCYPSPALDVRSCLFDFHYFKYMFMKLQGVEFHESRLEDDLESFARKLADAAPRAFLYRDFQARNVMLRGGTEPFFIDFQGGRLGPVHYDLASFLWQASARYPDDVRQRLIHAYLEELQHHVKIDVEAFERELNRFVLFRLLQVLGAYGFRGLWERKQHFLESIPPAISSLEKILLTGACDEWPYLKDVLETLCTKVKSSNAACSSATGSTAGRHVKELLQADTGYQTEAVKPLVVRVFSFSYKKGIPEDTSGNGGGYVFDCRGTHNPGRYDEYKPLTGLDKPVVDFLEADGEILTFLESVYRLADFHVKRFMERGFTNLMFSCGCTGGRHRSVYSAQHLAEHIHRKFGVEVRICHREQGIQSVLPAQSSQS